VEKYLRRHGKPLCDFKLYRNQKKKNLQFILQNAVKRIMVLNRKNANLFGARFTDIMRNLESMEDMNNNEEEEGQ